MTMLGAMVFGGFLALGVLWLLVTAPPGSDVDQAWDQTPTSSGTPEGVPGPRVLTHSSYN
ncbi:MAG: hypothetical protein WBV80_20785 [Mycobacterium sp.]